MDLHAITTAVDKAAALVGAEFEAYDVVWEPLQAVLPAEELGGWMYMGHTALGDGTPLFMYKHGITRRYLHLTATGQAYLYRPGPAGGASYGQIPLEAAIERAYADLEALGESRTTAYNEEYRRARNAAMVAAGWTVVEGNVT